MSHMDDAHPVERYEQLPTELRNKLSDLGPPAFVQIASLFNLGGLASAIALFVPNQRIDRLAVFLAELRRSLDYLHVDVKGLEEQMQADGGFAERARLFRDALSVAERAVSDERAARIGRLLADGLSGDEVRAQRTRTFIDVYENLTDIQVAVLMFFARRVGKLDNHWTPLGQQLASAPHLSSIFESDLPHWVACVSRLESQGLVAKSTVWGGRPDEERSPEDVDTMMHRVDLYELTAYGRELVTLLSVRH